MLRTKTLQQQRCKGCGSKGPEVHVDSRWWLPGVIVVEFKQRLSPGPIFGFTDSIVSQSQSNVPWLDLTRFRQIVGERLVKPPKWTFSFEPNKPPSRSNYERFITLYLQPDVNVPAIARELSTVGGVVRASPEPILLPPIPRIYPQPPKPVMGGLLADTLSDTLLGGALLDEPLAVSGGQPFGLSMPVGIQDLQNQWYLFRSKADVVLNDGTTNGAGVVVAVIDWGFNVDHQEFQNRIKYTYNAAQNNGNVASGPNNWHGTATLGLIGAGDNNAGMLGFAPGADLWAIQGQDALGNLDNQCWAQAIEKVCEKSSDGMPKVILVEASTNAGFNVESSTTLREPIKTAIADNCVVCVPAGNRGDDAGKGPNQMPIPETGSILVGATQYRDDPNNIKRGDSNFGTRIVVSAPGDLGTDVTTCACGNDSYTNTFGGTSGATAKVAGAMALLLQRFPGLTHQEIVQVMKTQMPQIQTTSRPMGCFLDLEQLIANIAE